MVIYKKKFPRNLHVKAEWTSKQNILIADTVLTGPGPYPGIKALGGKMHFYGGKILIFIICLKQIFLSTTKFGEHKKDLGITVPECPTVSAGLGRTVARKSSIEGFMFVQGVDILKMYF